MPIKKEKTELGFEVESTALGRVSKQFFEIKKRIEQDKENLEKCAKEVIVEMKKANRYKVRIDNNKYIVFDKKPEAEKIKIEKV